MEIIWVGLVILAFIIGAAFVEIMGGCAWK